MASKLENKIKYDAKVAELRKYVELEAQALQDVIESKESSLVEVRELSERKAYLAKQIAGLEKKLSEAETNFIGFKDKKQGFVNSAKNELSDLKKSLKETGEALEVETARLQEARTVAKELKEFVKKEADARGRWLQENVKLGVLLSKQEEVRVEIEKEKKEAESKKDNLDGLKAYLTEFYGKIGSYITTAKETLEHVNKSLEESGVPIHFDIPSGEILKVDINNFEQLR